MNELAAAPSDVIPGVPLESERIDIPMERSIVALSDHPITDAVEQAMLEATRNASYNIKRALLDFVELQERNAEMRRQLTPELRAFLEMFRKRIHNDVSQIEYVFQAIIGMARRGGEIPRFGRSREQISEADKKKDQKKAS